MSEDLYYIDYLNFDLNNYVEIHARFKFHFLPYRYRNFGILIILIQVNFLAILIYIIDYWQYILCNIVRWKYLASVHIFLLKKSISQEDQE